MVFSNKTVFFLLLASVAASEPSRNDEMRLLAKKMTQYECAELKGCYLWNIEQKRQKKLTGDDIYCSTKAIEYGWSVHCDDGSMDDETTKLDSITFSYDGTDVVETAIPRWMAGDTPPTDRCASVKVVPVDYLAKPGKKEFVVEGHLGGKSCFQEKFVLNDRCADTETKNAPLPAPVPIPSPTTGSPTAPPVASFSEAGCAVMPEDVNYNIIAKHNDMGLQITNLSTKEGAKTMMWPVGELFSFKPAKDGYFYIVGENSGLGLQINGQSTVRRQPVVTWPITEDQSDMWCLKPYGEGYYSVVNRKSGLALSVERGSKLEGAPVVQDREHESASRMWRLEVATAAPTMSPTVTMSREERMGLIQALPTPPEMVNCARAADKLIYRPDVPSTWQIEGKNPAGESKKLQVKGYSPLQLVVEDQEWWHAFSPQYHPDFATQLRFVNDKGVVGPWHTCVRNSPIGLDINKSGSVERIEGKFTIDISGDGDIQTLSEWFAPTEGILVDVTHGIEDGIVNGHHLFGDMGGVFSDGFAKLILFDDNTDGYVTGDELDGLAVWVDANSNAKLDEGELTTMADHNIISIGTDHDTYISSATLTDGSDMHVEDLWFAR